MKNEKTIFKGFLYKIDTNINEIKEEEIFYHIIKIDVDSNKYFFAEEISTGCIFPVFYSADIKRYASFFSPSYLRYGNYFVYTYIMGYNYKLGGYYFDINMQKTIACVPTQKEIEIYLDNRKNNFIWRRKIETMAKKNIFWCDIDEIKKIIITEGKSVYKYSQKSKRKILGNFKWWIKKFNYKEVIINPCLKSK